MAGNSTPEERSALASASTWFRFLERRLISLADRRWLDGEFEFRYGFNTYHIPPEYGVVVTFNLYLDGSPVGSSPWGTDYFYHATGSGGRVSLASLSVGRHVFSGFIDIQFARSRYPHSTEEYELIDVPSVQLDITPFAFVAVDEYPADYPIKIVDKEYERQFAERFRLDEVSLAAEQGSASAAQRGIWISTGARDPADDQYDVLRIDISFPIPPLEIACRARLQIPELGFDCTFHFVVGPSDESATSTGLFKLHLPTSGAGFLGRSQGRYTLSVQADMCELLGARVPSDLVAEGVSIEVGGSRHTALRAAFPANVAMPTQFVGEWRNGRRWGLKICEIAGFATLSAVQPAQLSTFSERLRAITKRSSYGCLTVEWRHRRPTIRIGSQDV